MDRTVYFDELVERQMSGGSFFSRIGPAVKRAATSAFRFQSRLGGGIDIPKPAFIKEHKHLINVLEKGKKSSRRREAADQKKELMKVLSGSGIFASKKKNEESDEESDEAKYEKYYDEDEDKYYLAEEVPEEDRLGLMRYAESKFTDDDDYASPFERPSIQRQIIDELISNRERELLLETAEEWNGPLVDPTILPNKRMGMQYAYLKAAERKGLPKPIATKPEPPKVEKKVPEKKKSFFERTFSTRYGKR
jgi:hypothetical protein